MKNKLCIENIKKIYKTKDGDLTAIEDITLNIREGEIIGIIGLSGCGKSTLLNIIAGLDEKTSGFVRFSNENPRISYMLQSDALLPWKTVLENATLGLELMHLKNEETVEFVYSLLDDYGLLEFADEYPSSLSGGMRQRVALIRSLAIKPDILLLDEPFSALDYYTRLQISSDVHNIIKDTNTTAIIITHDIQEALSLADRVIVLSNRPSTVKNDYEISFKDKSSIMEKRKSEDFNSLYEKIWSDLDVQI